MITGHPELNDGFFAVFLVSMHQKRFKVNGNKQKENLKIGVSITDGS